MKMENFLKDSPGKKEKKVKIKEEIKVKEEEDENKEQVNKRIYTLWKTLSVLLRSLSSLDEDDL